MKRINLIIAVLMGAYFALAAPTLAQGPIQGIAGSLGAAAPMFLKALNMSDPAPGPESTSTPVPVDGALVETRDLGYTHCDLWEDANGNPLITYSTQSYKVRKNMDKIRARSDKPKTLPDGNCERVICEDNSGIVWCANITSSPSYTVESWDTIIDAAQTVMDTCDTHRGDGWDGWFNGMAFYNEGWFGAVTYCN